MLTPEELAQILQEEFERDHWGTIEPFWFGHLDDTDNPEHDYHGLRQVLERVCNRLIDQKEFECPKCGFAHLCECGE